jgi:hypothetical protein
MAVGSLACAARNTDAGQRGFDFWLFAGSCLSNLFAFSRQRYADSREFANY